MTEVSPLPHIWHAIFVDFRRSGDSFSPAKAKQWAVLIHPDHDWPAIEREAPRWRGVTERSAIAKSSLALYDALKAVLVESPEA